MNTPQKSQPIFDLQKIRKDAAESVEKGAVTKDYPLDLNQAYALLNEALATEILCVLRYRHHQIVAKGIDFPQVAAEFTEHADDEQRHMLMIAERIDQLGGDPDFNPATILQRASTEYGTGGALNEMIKQDLVAERIAVEIYRKLIAWFGEKDSTTRRMLESILEDEEEHASDLADLLAAIDPRATPKSLSSVWPRRAIEMARRVLRGRARRVHAPRRAGRRARGSRRRVRAK